MEDNSNFKRCKKLEAQLNFCSARREMLEEKSETIKNELARIDDEITRLTKELLACIETFRKS